VTSRTGKPTSPERLHRLSKGRTVNGISVAGLVAQGDTNSIGCRITVNGVVKDEKSVNEMNAYTFCLVKSA